METNGIAGDKETLKETQSINKSFSVLGDVIGALEEKWDKYITHRNSKVSSSSDSVNF